MRAEARAERLPEQLEADRREQQDDLPVDLEARGPCCQTWRCRLGEDERREVPDRFLRAQLAQAAAGEAAADGERQRDALAGDERRHADHQPPTIAPAYGPAMRPGEERAFERQVGGVVVQQQPRRRRRPSAACRAPAAKISRSGQSRRSKIRMCRNRRYRTSIVASTRHDGQLDDQRRQQELVRRQNAWVATASAL